MTSNTRIDLMVPFTEKEDAKAKGARWDSQRKIWYAPPNTNLQLLQRWLPDGVAIERSSEIARSVAGPEKGVALSELLGRVKGLIDRGLPEAVWVQAEISELRGKNGHLYLSLTERSPQGDMMAQVKGVIWKNRADAITAKFARATGEGLKTDIKILFLALVRFDPIYGLDLVIEDVDPSYTLGDLAAKLARIRQELQLAGLYELNKQVPPPVEFMRVAVISPELSAGLGDFRREADLLQRAGLCDFHFFQATFQGVDAPSSVQTALLQALTAHKQHVFDVLVVIRGGGAVTDLAWLNDLDLAKLVCQAGIPVYTGIGHERDNTILDEIAHQRFDTPSKVALHIASTIKQNAFGAIEAWARIMTLVARIVHREQAMVETQAERIESGARGILTRVEADAQAFARLIQTATSAQIRQATLSLETQKTKLLEDAEKTQSSAGLAIAHVTDAVAQRAGLQLARERAEIDRLAHSIVLQTQAGIGGTAANLYHLRSQVCRDSTRLITKAADDVEATRDVVSTGTASLLENARKDIQTFARIVVGLAPQSTLERGFAIARSDEDEPLTSREAAIQRASFRIEFRDGAIAVDNRDYDRGEW
jgi:exodeoxyribonuclease VII large subunit